MAVFGEDGAAGEAWLDERRDRWVLGTPEAARARIAEYESTGIDRLLLQDFLPADTDHIAAMGELIGR
jgi:alkanesulfonate monooxygenase SsuD/methylene tetrahydromethanopterin reductase-like flavin-dependent oxidoreductase (luciferase family)